MEISPEFLFFGRVTGKNEINIVFRLIGGKIIYIFENYLILMKLKRRGAF